MRLFIAALALTLSTTAWAEHYGPEPTGPARPADEANDADTGTEVDPGEQGTEDTGDDPGSPDDGPAIGSSPEARPDWDRPAGDGPYRPEDGPPAGPGDPGDGPLPDQG